MSKYDEKGQRWSLWKRTHDEVARARERERTDVIETLEQATSPESVDLEGDGLSVWSDDDVSTQVDLDLVLGRSVVEEGLALGLRQDNGKHAILEAVVAEDNEE